MVPELYEQLFMCALARQILVEFMKVETEVLILSFHPKLHGLKKDKKCNEYRRKHSISPSCVSGSVIATSNKIC